MCEVDVFTGESSGANAARVPGGTPGFAVPMLRSVISCARCFRYAASTRPARFTGTKSLSARYWPRSANARRPASEKRWTASGCGSSFPFTVTGGTTPMLRTENMPSICATATPPDDGGGMPHTRHCR